jgi:hypothetical protein
MKSIIKVDKREELLAGDEDEVTVRIVRPSLRRSLGWAAFYVGCFAFCVLSWVGTYRLVCFLAQGLAGR